MRRKDKVKRGIFIILFLVIGLSSFAQPPGGNLPKPGQRAPSRPASPTGTSIGERTQEMMGVSGTLTINEISPRIVYTNTAQITVSYNLSLSSPLNISRIPVKVGIFLDNQLKNTVEINNFPNHQSRRLFISSPTPSQAKDYRLSIKAVRADVSPDRARADQIYASAEQIIRVNEALPDLIVESFTVSQPRITERGGSFVAEFPLNIRVKNIGVAPAGRFDVAVKEKVISDTELFRARIEGLNPGESRDISGVSRGLDPTLYSEGFRFQAKVDEPPVEEFAPREGRIRELNEDNNLSEIVRQESTGFISIATLTECYRGSHIEILGNFGSSFGNNRVALESGGSIVGYAELINFSPNKITVKIPKTDNIKTEATYQIFIQDGNGRRISNLYSIYINKPIKITEIKSKAPLTYSPTGGMPLNILINGYLISINYEWKGGTGTLKWAIVSSLPARDDEFKDWSTLGELVHYNPINLPAGRYYFVLRDFSHPSHGTAESEGVTFQEVTVKDVEKRGFSAPILKAVGDLQVRASAMIDYRASDIKLDIYSKNAQYAHTEDLPQEVGEFIDKGPAGVRDILYRIQHILGASGNTCSGPLSCPIDGKAWNIYNDRIILPLTFETDSPIEIKRYAQGALGNWNDDLAYDINLTSFSLLIKFKVGSRGLPLTVNNIINDLEIDVNLSAEISNVPDWMEVWGIVDRRISEKLKNNLINFLSSDSLKNNFYNGFMDQIKTMEELKNVVVLSAYTSDTYLWVEYITL